MTQKPAIKNGKIPLSDKKNPFLDNSIFNDILYIDPPLKAELDSQNFQPKWLDAQETYKNSGYDPEGWTVYKRKANDSDKLGLSDVKFGQDPTGVVRRGSLILGVMDKERHAQLREALQIKSDRQLQNLNKKKADELRQTARGNNLEVEIHEGYDEND